MLASYAAHRPPWKVAGVDYRVGHPTNITLKPATNMNIPGVTRNNKAITITGANVVIDGFDLRGYSVSVKGNNATISNCDPACPWQHLCEQRVV